MKLALGTVQFGIDYGVNSLNGQVKSKEVKKILNYAYSKNIDLLDTALNYGNSEKIIGRFNVLNFKVVTKTRCFDNPKINNNDVKLLNNDFHQSLKNLKQVRLSGGYYASIEADFKKIMLFINKAINELEINIVYKEDNHNTAYECIREINNRFKHLKKLSLDCSSYFIDNIEGSNFNYEKNSFNFEEKKGVYYDKKNKLKSDHIKYKFNFDIKAINNLKKLETLFFNKNYEFNNQIINEDELFKFNKLSRIVTDTALFNNKFYSNIKKRQNEYYLNCKKLKKYKSIKSAYYLEGKHWERYKELGINVGYGYYGKSAEDILEERKKKKNETAN